MRILVLTDLFPPVAFGGYEMDCAAFVASARAHHDIVVLTSDLDRHRAPHDPAVRRVLPWGRGSRVRRVLAAPRAAARGAELTERALVDVRPDVVVVFNLLGVPQSALLAVLASGHSVVLRLAETYYATELLGSDPFLRHLAPGARGLRGVWSLVARGLNRLPALRLEHEPPARIAVSWASKDLSGRVALPSHLDVSVERVIHPVSLQTADFAGLEQRPAVEPTVLYLGRVTRDKGIEVAYRAVALLRERHGLVARLVVAGPVEARTASELAELARQLGIAAQVALLGPVDAAGIAAQFRTAHALVVPSLVEEVYGLVVVEAATARVPVVASRTGGIPEVLDDGEECLLFEPGDVADCAQALAATLRDPQQARERAERAFSRVSALTPQAYADAWEDLLTSTVAAQGRAEGDAGAR